jgi:hypothetical protein
MRLALKQYHFFRSSWNIEKVGYVLDTGDLKYLDLTVLNRTTYKKYTRGLKSVMPQASADLSYWNTYGFTRGNDLLGTLTFRYLYQIDEICGAINLRSDNMDDDDFATLAYDLAPKHNNKNWKTAHIEDLWGDIDPHWNMYHSEPPPYL